MCSMWEKLSGAIMRKDEKEIERVHRRKVAPVAQGKYQASGSTSHSATDVATGAAQGAARLRDPPHAIKRISVQANTPANHF